MSPAWSHALGVAYDVAVLAFLAGTFLALACHLAQQHDSNALLKQLLAERRRTLHLVNGELPDLEREATP